MCWLEHKKSFIVWGPNSPDKISLACHPIQSKPFLILSSLFPILFFLFLSVAESSNTLGFLPAPHSLLIANFLASIRLNLNILTSTTVVTSTQPLFVLSAIEDLFITSYISEFTVLGCLNIRF